MTLSCRTVFVSDIHLGTRGCQAELLLDFIKSVECETLYLVGDNFDGWKMKSGWRWPQAHSDVVQKILRLARKGVIVIYVPGNHDDGIRDFCTSISVGWSSPGTPSMWRLTAGVIS